MKEYRFRIGGKEYEVAVNSVEGGVADVCVNGVSYSVEMENAPAPVQEKSTGPKAPVPVSKPAAPKSAAGRDVCSPLPGVILSVDVREGQSVRRGQKVAVLEAMKMENDILAESDGTVSAVYVAKGDSLLEGAKICSIA